MSEEKKRIKGMDVVFTEWERWEILRRLEDVLETSHIMWGPQQEMLQKKFCELTGKEWAVGFNSCTSGFEILFRWVRERTSVERVVFQANMFPSPVFAALRSGLEVGWVDIAIPDLCPSVAELDFEYARRPFQCLVLMHTAGYVSDMVWKIKQWCVDNRVLLIEDCSHAGGSRSVPVDGKELAAGSFGDVAMFSLAATKPLHCGQGGMLCTDDDDLAETSFVLKNYGRTEMFQKGRYVDTGYNCHMTELQAVVGLVMFETLERRVAERAEIAAVYDEAMKELGWMVLGSRDGRPNWYKYPVIPPVSRDELRKRLEEENIELGSCVYEFCTPFLEVFDERFRSYEGFPRCEYHAQSHVCLPLHNAMTRSDAMRVVEVLGSV